MALIQMKNVGPSSSMQNIIQHSEDNNSMPVSLENFNNNAISVQGVYKRYDKTTILNNLNMKVPDGYIYGLLGSSGCGKTTLLNCIMGITAVDIGEVHIKYKNISDVGLMPQDLALLQSLTIEETFYYFGKLFSMTKQQINDRTNELKTLLELPSLNQNTDHLSGGQQRRVSLAVALLHNPKILLLDEPTVGLDPILTQTVWDYLLSLTKQGKTVVITTHYIEMAAQANTVGLMRNGRLIEEGHPRQLMEKYNSITLEETFLLLSRDEENKANKDTKNWPESTPNTAPIQSPFRKTARFSFSRLHAQFYKNVLFIIRQTMFVGFLVCLPIIQCTMVNYTLGGNPQNLKLAIVNEDSTNCTIYTEYQGCHLDNTLSCRYINHVQHSDDKFQFVFETDFERAKNLVLKNKVWGLMYIQKNFSMILTDRIEHVGLFFNYTSEALDASTIQMHIDMTDKIIETFLKSKLTEHLLNFMQEVYRDCGWPEAAARPPIRFEDSIHGSPNSLHISYQVPILIMVFAFILPTMLTPAYILNEKCSGSIQRCIFSGLTTFELLIALFVIQVIVLSVQILVMFFILFTLYNHPFIGNAWNSFFLCFSQGISGIAFGFLMSIIFDTYVAAFLGTNCTTVLITLLSGFLWPLEGAHPLVTKLARFSPLALPSEAFRGITARGWTIAHRKIQEGYLSTLSWTIIYLLLMRLLMIKKKLIQKK